MSDCLELGCSMLLAGFLVFSESGLLPNGLRIVFSMLAILSPLEFMVSSLVIKVFTLGYGNSPCLHGFQPYKELIIGDG